MSDIGIEVDGGIALSLNGTPNVPIGLSGGPNPQLGLGGTGARLGLTAEEFALGLDQLIYAPNGRLVETYPGSGLWIDLGGVFQHVQSWAYVARYPQYFTGGPEFWEYVGS